MRFQDVGTHLLQFEAVRGACSREWRISDTLVMCTELDLSDYSAMPVSPLHTSPQRGAAPGFLKISFFRFGPGEAVRSWADPGEDASGMMGPAERGAVVHYRISIREWVMGDRPGLPASTSTRITRRLRNGHTGG